MAAFHLKVLTIDGLKFDGEVERCIIRTMSGDAAILPRHIRYVAALGTGSLIVVQNGRKREAAISGGFADVTDKGMAVFVHTCEWAEEIDIDRARKSLAEQELRRNESRDEKVSERDERRIRRSRNRIRVAEK